MTNKEIGGQPGFTPQGGAFCEAAPFVRELVKQGLMDREDGIRLTELAWRQTMFSQAQGIPVGLPEELLEHLKMFPGATDDNGKIIFSKT